MGQYPSRSLVFSLFCLGLAAWSACSDSSFSGGGTQGSKSSSHGKDRKKDPIREEASEVSPASNDSQDGNDENRGDDQSSEDHDRPADEGLGDHEEGLVTTESVKPKVPQFGLLVNDLECGLCHVKVNGDVASTADVNGLWQDSLATISGTWYAAKSFDVSKPKPGRPQVGVKVSVTVAGGVLPNYQGEHLPNDLDGDGFADFPRLNFDAMPQKMRGSLSAPGASVQRVHKGNLTLVGSPSDPIRLSGEVLVEGDLVIKGIYTGIGNIYVTGNIYIPADLKAANSAFPYPDGEVAAKQHARQAIKDKKDALGLATGRSIFVSDIENHGWRNNSVYEHPDTPAGRRGADLGVNGVYAWFPGGKPAFDALYEPSPIDCNYHGRADNRRSISLVEAFLYAGNTVAGRANRNSYAINGGIIADHFHMISSATACPPGIHPVFKMDQQNSYVNYDYRMKNGLLLLKQLAPYFE